MTTTSTSDPFQRFAAAHLGDRTERAVYTTVAGSAAEWTAGQTGVHAGVSHHEADQVLRRFAAAGIVERLDIPGRPHRYRWASTMAYLTATAAAAVDPVIDPICGMPVPADTAHVATDGPDDVRFCSLNCLVRWRAANRAGDQVHTRLTTGSVASTDGARLRSPR